MNTTEFTLLALICAVVPFRPNEEEQRRPFIRQLNQPTLTEVGVRRCNEGTIRIFQVSKNGSLVGYEFAFEGFPHKACILPGDIPELKYEHDSYQCLYRKTTNIRGYFPVGTRPTIPFIASFHHWGGKIYRIEVPIEKEAQR